MSTEKVQPQIEKSWAAALSEEFQKPYFQSLKEFLVAEKKSHQIYPTGGKIFAAFNETPFDKVKAVLIGQDPYHGAGQAHGLCFSVQPNVRIPPSLQNIYKEMRADIGFEIPNHGHLIKWAREGVMMLNAVLTVRHSEAGSHRGKGWENFTDAAIRKLSEEKSGLVFLLWGNFAKQKKALINTEKHHVLEAAHPSPFAAHNGFFGCRHFSKTNQFLESQGLKKINWQI